MLSAFNDEYSADDSTNCTFSINFLAKENVVTPGTNVESFCVKVASRSKVATALILNLEEHTNIVIHSERYENSTTADVFDLFTIKQTII